MYDIPLRVAGDLVKAWQDGAGTTRGWIIAAVALIASGGISARFSTLQVVSDAGVTAAVLGGAAALVIAVTQEARDTARRRQKIEEVEKRAQENPNEPKAAWDLARVKLESYVDRNLTQVRSIFWFTVLVMSCGFALIGWGAYQAFENPAKFNASVLTSISGVIVSFIGGTFLVLYKSTMEQAKDYVTMLDRINAVGMSVQVVATLGDDSKDLRNQTTAEVARQLLAMYSPDGAAKVAQPRS